LITLPAKNHDNFNIKEKQSKASSMSFHLVPIILPQIVLPLIFKPNQLK